MKKVKVSAPGKLLLFGDHIVVHGLPCIVTAVDQRLTVEISALAELKLKVENSVSFEKKFSDLGVGEMPKDFSFVEYAVKFFYERYPFNHGVHLQTHSTFSTKYGFGSSSAVTVAVVKALAVLNNLNLSNFDIFQIAYQAVIAVQGVGSGADLAAAIWGGTILYVSPAKVVESIKVEKIPLVVGYTGVKAHTPTIIKQVNELRLSQPEKFAQLFKENGLLVEQAKQAMEEKNWPVVGELMTKNQAMLDEMQVNSEVLDRLIKASVLAGAYGAKLSGAGIGDCMVAVVPEKNRDVIEQAIENSGGEPVRIEANAEGVRVEKI